MVDAVSEILTLAGEAESDDPYAALRAITRLRAELDRAEATAVRRARNAGHSWQVIAMGLDVSKQAVHRKYGRA